MKREVRTVPEADKVPSPKQVMRRANSMPWKENARVDISPYQNAILALRDRGYSFGEIADWLGKEINAPVKRGQVYYVYQSHLAEREADLDEGLRRGTVKSYPAPKISEDEAERRAAEVDAKKKT